MEQNLEHEAINSVREEGKFCKKCLIIIPCYNEEKILFEHLDALQRQSGGGFDVAVIISGAINENAVFGKIKDGKYKYAIALITRTNDTGSAGGFYLGDKYALEKGYKCVIFADVDGIPEQGDLVQKLLEEFDSGEKLVIPKNNLYYEGESVRIHGCQHHYGLASCKLMEKVGLHFAPLYLGSDDLEYGIRLGKMAKIKRVDRTVAHPFVILGSKNFDREAVYNVNMALFGIPENMKYYLYVCGFLPACFLAFGTARARGYAKTLILATLYHKYGKELSQVLKKVEPLRKKIGNLKEYEAVLSPIKSMRGDNILLIENSHSQNEGAKFFEGFSFIFKVFGKETLAFLASGNIIATSMIVAKKVWVKEGDVAFLICDNSSPLRWVCKMAVFCILLPSLVALAFFTLLLNLARKENTYGYGLESKPIF